MALEDLHRGVLYLPAVTTLFSAFFSYNLFRRYRDKGGGAHLLWWGIGMVTYGIGTFTEAWTSIAGWHPAVFKAWYIAGAFLGGYPLAQGSIFLLMRRRFAVASAWIASGFILVASLCLLASPIAVERAQEFRLSGDVLEWGWVRLLSPFINIYSLIFLVGGAIVSAIRFRRHSSLRHRYLGNIWIAVGALLPGIGGSFTRFGYVEALYITELVGLLCIYRGYRLNIRDSSAVRARAVDPTPTEPDMSPATSRLALLLAPLLALSIPLSAQDDGASTEEPASFFATTTVTATGSEIDTFEIANPVNVITAEEIETVAPQNASDLLRSEPGVDVDGVGPNQSRPIVRGQRGLRVLFLENGLRMNNPRRQTDFGEIPGLVDIDDVAVMEVVRGPSSVLYGSDAIGGVLNLVTRSAIIGSDFAGSLSGRYASAGSGTQFGAHLSGGGERSAWKLSLTERSFDDYDAAAGSFGAIDLTDGATVTDTGLDDTSVSASLVWALDDSSDLRLRWNRYRADDTGFGFVEPELIGDDSGARIRILYPFQDFDRLALSYTGSDFALPWIDSLDAQLYHQSNERNLVNDIFIDIGPIAPGFPNSSVQADTDNFTDLDSLGLRLEAVKSFGGRHLLTYGVEAYEDESFNTDASVTTTTIAFPFPPFAVVDVQTDTVANAPNATNSSAGIFAQTELAAGDRWKLTFGARSQTVDTRAEATPGWDISGLDFSDSATVASASALFRASDNIHLSLAWGSAFRAPNLIERLFNGLTPEGIGFQILNPDLTSEDSETVDLGLKYRRADTLMELNLFRTDIDDGIVQYFLTGADIAALPTDVQDEIAQSGVTFVVQQRNIDRLRYEGVELLVQQRLGNAWTLGGNATYLDAERLDSANPPTGDTFGEKLNLFGRWQPDGGRGWVEYRLRHNGGDRANLDPGEPVPPVGPELPSFTVHTLAAGYEVGTTGRLRHHLGVVVDNLTDELYAEFSNAAFFRPQPERRVVATYRLRF